VASRARWADLSDESGTSSSDLAQAYEDVFFFKEAIQADISENTATCIDELALIIGPPGGGCKSCPVEWLIDWPGTPSSDEDSDAQWTETDEGTPTDESNETDDDRHFPTGLMYSEGSVQCRNGQCRPCAFLTRPSGCQQGPDCKFCHFHVKQKTRKTGRKRNFRCTACGTYNLGRSQACSHCKAEKSCSAGRCQ